MSELPQDTVQRAYVVEGGLPRMVLPDLAWVGGCSSSAGWPGRGNVRPVSHEPCVSFVILGSEKTLMLDTGHFGHWWSLDGQLDAVLQGRPLDYVFLSHQEIPHTGNMGRLMKKYPNCIAIGDTRDYHLFHPEVDLDRIVRLKHGEKVSLGDRDIIMLDAIWKDLTGTLWAYDTKRKLIYTADGFGYVHTHEENICGMMFHEMSDEQFDACTDRPALPFFGMRQRDQKARVAAFRNLMKQYPIEIITSGHCGPIMGPRLQPAIERLLAKIEDPNVGPRFLSADASAEPQAGYQLHVGVS